MGLAGGSRADMLRTARMIASGVRGTRCVGRQDRVARGFLFRDFPNVFP